MIKKLLFLLLLTTVTHAQVSTGNEAYFDYGIQIAPSALQIPTTVPYVGTFGADGVQGRVLPQNITIPQVPLNYGVLTPTIGGHLSGIDSKLGTLVGTTAGITTRIWFTADVSNVSSVNYYATNATGKGTIASAIQNVVNNDNEKKYFAQDLMGAPFASAIMFPPGTYAGNLSASTSPNSAQQRWTVELYKCNNAGTPIASGVTGAPVGSLGVTVITILDSGLLTLADGNVTNVQVSGLLGGTGFSIAVGERIRYHVSAEKFGTAGANITQSVYYGTSYNSFIDVPVTFSMQSVYNTSANPQIVTNATQGAVTIKNGGVDIANVFAVQSATGINKLLVTGDGIIKANAGFNDVIIQNTLGNQIFRGVMGNSWTDSLPTTFFQVGAIPGRIGFTDGNGNPTIRTLVSSLSTHITSSIYSSAKIPTGILEVGNITDSMFNVFTSGRSSFGTNVDNGVDKLNVVGTVLSTGFKVAGTLGFLKSDGTVDTVISTIGNSVGINQAVPESTLHIGDGNAILLDRYKNGSAGASNFLGRAYNGTKLLPTTLLDNQDIAIFGANPYNGIDAEGHKAGLKFTTNGVQTASNRGTKVDISITPLNATTPSASVFNADSNRVLLSDASISLSTPVAVGWFGKGEIAGENPHKFQVVSEGLNPTVSFGQFGGVGSAGNAGGHLWASRGTVTSPSAIQSGDYLWSWGFRGQGATTRAPSSANMSIRATENFTDTAHGTEIKFGTNATGHDANLGRTSEFVMQQDGGFLAPHHLVESYSALGQNGSYRFKDHPSNPDSRSWRIGNDYDDFGDFAILQSTTKTGTFFSKKFSIDPVGVVGIGNLAGTGTRQVVADEDGKLSDMPIRRTFSTVVSWTGTYAGSTADYIMDRETGHFNNPNFVDTVNFGNYLYVPFKCKIKAVVHGGNALGTPVLLKISKVVTSTTFDLLASKSVGTYANSPVGSVFTYGTDIDSTKTIDAGGQVMISFNNNNISTGVWRSPLLTIYFEEEF